MRRTVLLTRLRVAKARLVLRANGPRFRSGLGARFGVIASRLGRGIRFAAGKAEGFTGARFAQHGCSLPQGIAAGVSVTAKF